MSSVRAYSSAGAKATEADALVIRHAELVKRIAYHLAGRLPPSVDVDDLMIHTLFDSPKEQALRDSGYADNPIEILRWKKR